MAGIPKSGFFRIDYMEKEGKLTPVNESNFGGLADPGGSDAILKTFRYYTRKEPEMFNFNTNGGMYAVVVKGTLKNSLAAYDHFEGTDDIKAYYIKKLFPSFAGLCSATKSLELGFPESDREVERRLQNKESLLPKLMVSRADVSCELGGNDGLNAIMSEIEKHYRKLIARSKI